jgi:phage FluMu gp28-like protein
MHEFEYTRPWLANYQLRLIDDPERFTICEAATKCGKTASHIIWLFERALDVKKVGGEVWWVAPVYQQAKIAFTRMRNQFEANAIVPFFKVNETELTLTLPNGAVVRFKTAEKPDNLYGEDVYAAVFDEFTRAKEAAWFALRSTLTATNGQCKMIGNARGKKNWGYLMGVKAKNGEPGYSYHKITIYDALEREYLALP